MFASGSYFKKSLEIKKIGTIILSYPPPPSVRVRATAKLSAVFFHDESSIIIGGYESAIVPKNQLTSLNEQSILIYGLMDNVK